MLLYPSVNKLQEKTDSRYSLVMLTAKRARDIVDGKPALTEEESERPVSQAAKEIADDMITYIRPQTEAEAEE
jgi:DNA-directed RNA polymerase omega subunit